MKQRITQLSKLFILNLLSGSLLLSSFNSCVVESKQNSAAWDAMDYPAPADSINLVKMNESVFGKPIPLKGEYVTIDPIIMPAEMEAFIKDGFFFLKHLEKSNGEPSLHVMKLPSMNVITELAKRGDGPAEVLDTRLIQTTDR